MKKTNKKRGFTLVELAIVIAIIGILATVTIVGVSSAMNKAKEAAALTEARATYTKYFMENVEMDTTKNYYVETTYGYYFKIVDGELKTKALDEAPANATKIP